MDFTAQARGTAVVLAWHTETNSDLFGVERSRDGATFTKLATIAACGTTTQAQAYTYRDALLPTGASLLYYHLQLVDRDGTAAYSPVRSVALSATGLSLFPNLITASSATLTGAAPSTCVHVLDPLGRVMFTTSTDVTGTAILLLPPTLPNGVYLVRAGQQTVRLTVE